MTEKLKNKNSHIHCKLIAILDAFVCVLILLFFFNKFYFLWIYF